MMTYKEIFTMINSIGYPASYNHFPDETQKAPPFICFYYAQSDNPIADDRNYVKVEQVCIQLFTANKDFAAEQAVEAVLRANELPYTRFEEYFDDEKMYMQLYTTEVIIDEQD